MNQSSNLRIPAPLHAQLKALAATRGTTMVDVLHDTVRQAIEAGEIPDEVPGFKVSLLYDMDADNHGPFVVVETPGGTFPRLKCEEAEIIASRIERLNPGDTLTRHSREKGGRWTNWTIENAGTSVRIACDPHDSGERVEVVLTVAFARDFARLLRRVAESAM